ncbi:MAG: DUF2489 domain-containing protein [Gammaproteobacteria bacterium]|nr:DUF2489 domain-containing protein [Gammaproteobacteria bacterium]
MDRPAINDLEAKSRKELAALAQEMIDGRLSFVEGAPKVLALKESIGGIADRDRDFDAFVAISSETDHLPLEAHRHRWSPQALKRLAPEFDEAERWAKGFAPEACRNLIGRFGEAANRVAEVFSPRLPQRVGWGEARTPTRFNLI